MNCGTSILLEENYFEHTTCTWFKMILNQIIKISGVSTLGTDNKRYSYCLSEKPVLQCCYDILVDQEIIHIGLLGAPASRNM